MNSTVTIPDLQAPALPSRPRLTTRVLIRSVVFSAVFGLLVFVPAGTWHFWQAWVLAPSYVLPIIGFLLWLVIVDPATAQRRMERGEREPTQRKVVRYIMLLYLIALAAPGLDYRFGWTREAFGPLPGWVSLAADVLVAAGVFLGFWTVNVNRYAAHTVRVEDGQQVIDSGPYRLIRHPMYTGICLAQLAMPLGLASVVTIPLFAALIPFFVVRLLNEEKVLRRDLAGYSEYCKRTPFRLIPFVW